MKRYQSFLPVMLLLFLFIACEDRLDVSVDDEMPRLVVEGRITNSDEPAEVRLSWTTGYGTNYQRPKASGAVVCISDSEGSCIELHETHEGVYSAAGTGLRGVSGRSYTVEINLPDGRNYVSEPEVLRAAPGIDSAYGEFFYRERINSSNYTERVPSVQLYADVVNPPDEDNFTLWEWEGVYEFIPPLAPVPRPCWIREPELYSRFNLISDENFSSSLVKAVEIDIIDVDYRFAFRYSVELQQLEVSAEAFEYLRGLRYQLDRSGSITDPPPYRVRGNIRNPANENEVVLGYFYAAGRATNYLFVERNQIPLVSVGERSCDGPPFAPPPPVCVYCLPSLNGSTEPPSYWKR